MLEFPKPQPFITKVSNMKWLTKSALEVGFELVNPTTINFIPGQFVSIEVSQSTFRSYSICSNYKHRASISIVASVSHDGVGSNFLRRLKTGDRVNIIGPSGRFVLSENQAENLFFLATGTGLSPLISMLYKIVLDEPSQKIKLLFGHRYHSDLFFIDRLDEFKSKLADFNYEVYLSKPEVGWNGKTGYITDYLNEIKVNNVQFYLCGNPNMIDDAIRILSERKVALSNVFFEKYKRAVQ